MLSFKKTCSKFLDDYTLALQTYVLWVALSHWAASWSPGLFSWNTALFKNFLKENNMKPSILFMYNMLSQKCFQNTQIHALKTEPVDSCIILY